MFKKLLALTLLTFSFAASANVLGGYAEYRDGGNFGYGIDATVAETTVILEGVNKNEFTLTTRKEKQYDLSVFRLVHRSDVILDWDSAANEWQKKAYTRGMLYIAPQSALTVRGGVGAGLGDYGTENYAIKVIGGVDYTFDTVHNLDYEFVGLKHGSFMAKEFTGYSHELTYTYVKYPVQPYAMFGLTGIGSYDKVAEIGVAFGF